MPTSLLPNPINVRINSGLPDPANIRIVKENLPDPSNIRIVSPIPQPLPPPTRQEQLAKESNDYGFNLLTGTASEAGKEAYNLAKKTFSPFDIRNATDPIAEVIYKEVISGKPPIQAYKDMGKGVARAGYDTLQGLSHAVGDPLGTTDIASGDLTFPIARQAWIERPYESAVGVSPILTPLLMKGISAIPRRQPEIKISPEAKQAYTSGIQEIGQTLKNIPDEVRPQQARVVADLRNQMRSALFKDDVATINSIVADFREGQTIPTAQPSKPTLRIPSQVEIPTETKDIIQPITKSPRDLSESLTVETSANKAMHNAEKRQKILDILSGMRKNIAQEDFGRSSIEKFEAMEEATGFSPKEIANEFINKTYSELDDQTKKKFDTYISRVYGEPDSDFPTHLDVLKYEIPKNFESLEGTSRGLYVLMDEANKRAESKNQLSMPLPKLENVEIVKPQPKGFTPIEASPVETAQPKGFGKPQDLFAKPTEETKIVYGAIDEEVKLLEPKIPLRRRNELFEQARTEGAALMKKRMGVTDYTTLTKPIYRNLLKAEAEKQSAPIEASPVTHTMPSGEVMPGAEHKEVEVPIQDELLHNNEPVTKAEAKGIIAQSQQDYSPKAIKQHKEYLFDQIDEAIKDAKDYEVEPVSLSTYESISQKEAETTNKLKAAGESVGFVTIEVPGDGKFRIINSKQALTKFKNDVVSKFPTTKISNVQKIEKAPLGMVADKAIGLDKTMEGTYESKPIHGNGNIILFTPLKIKPKSYRLDPTGDRVPIPERLNDLIDKKTSHYNVDDIVFIVQKADEAEGVSNIPLPHLKEDMAFAELYAGDKHTFISQKYYNYIKAHFPDATFKIADAEKAVQIYSNKKLVGLVMPLNLPTRTPTKSFTQQPKPKGEIVKASSARENIVSEPKEEYRHAGLPIPSIIKSFAKLPGIEKIVGFFNPLKGLSPEADVAYQNIRNKEKGREARVQRFVMNQFDRLSEMPTEARNQMFHALTSRESITKLPKEYWRKAESLRSLHKYMGQMAVKRGLLSPETYAANKGEWVKHLYEKYMEEKKESLNKQQSSMTMQLDWRKRKLPDTSFGVDEQRARGLKEDVATAVPVGMTEVLTDLARSDMFDEILKNPELTWQPSVVSVDNGQGGLETWSIGNLQKHIESQGQAVLRNPGNVAMKNELARLQGIMEQAQKESGNAPKGYTQLPSTPAYGKLAGAYVKDAVARDIMPALAMFGKGTSESAFYNAVQKVMTKGMAIFKASKVALNLPSWFRNGGADVIMFNMKGTPLYEIPYWLEQSAVNMMKGTPEYTQAFRQGLFRTKYSDIEINNFLGTSRKLLGQDYSGITETLSGAANLYGKIDDWFKFAIYLEERSKGADVSTAVRQANKWGMDYSLVNPAVKIARQSLVPFASFNYKFVPLFAETAAQRPWIMAKYMAIPFIMLKAVQSMYDMTDEDVRKLVLSLPSYVRKQKTLLPLPHMSPEGNLEWVDIGYFLPWNTEIQAYKAIKEKDMGGMLRTIGVGNPFLDIYALAKSGHQGNPPRNPYNGQEIYNRLDDLPTKLFKLLEYNYNLFAPGMATRYGAAGKITEIGKKDKYGRTVTPLQAMLRFIGVNVIAPSKEQGRIEKVAKIKELQSSLYKGFRDARGDRGKQKQLRESFKEKRRKILAGED